MTLKDIKPIKHQTQPIPTGCVMTCLAMLLGRPVLELCERYHVHYYIKQNFEIFDMLEEEGIEYRRVLSGCIARMDPYGLYWLAVPSLNLPGQMHAVLVDYRDPTRPQCYDPAKGLPNTRYYVLHSADVDEDESGLAFQLLTWVVDFVIIGVHEQ